MSLLTSFRALRRRRHGLAAGAAALGTAVLAVGLTVAPASASQYYGTLPFHSLGGNQQWYLGSNGSGVYGTTGAQQWDFFQSYEYYVGGQTTWNFRAAGTGSCLDGNYAGAVYASPCDSNNTYQNWSIGGGNSLGFTVQSYQTGLCLNIDPGSGAVNAIGCNWNNLNEVWNW